MCERRDDGRSFVLTFLSIHLHMLCKQGSEPARTLAEAVAARDAREHLDGVGCRCVGGCVGMHVVHDDDDVASIILLNLYTHTYINYIHIHPSLPAPWPADTGQSNTPTNTIHPPPTKRQMPTHKD